MVEDRRAHERLDTLEVTVTKHLAEHAAFEKTMAEHTVMIKQIAENTSEIVTIFKGIKGFRTLFLWFAPLIAGACAAWVWLKNNG